MTARLLNGKAIAEEIRGEIAEQVVDFVQNNGEVPCLAAVLVGDDAASQVYVRNKRRACQRAGIESRLHQLDRSAGEEELLELVAELNKDASVHGILVQLPLPERIRAPKVLDAVDPLKDVDCFHPDNVGRLLQGRPRFLPCTPHGVQRILHQSGIATAGKQVVILGRSDIVGKPLAAMLMQRDSPLGVQAANATVTICHSRSQNLPAITRQADILVVAMGRPRFVHASMVRPGATVIDVGINRTADGLVGDVDSDEVGRVAAALTPVPGGVGPLTVTMLLANTLTAAEAQLR